MCSVLLAALLVLVGAWAGPVGEARSAEGLAGKILVATPEMPDPRFMRTVLYMVRHDADGAMGLVLNRPMGEIPLARLLDRFGFDSSEASGTIRTHYGGPVQRTRGFLLHTTDYRGKSTVLIDDTAALTSDPEIWRDIAAGTGPRRRRFVVGHSGWAPGQLETEMRAGHWVAVPADEALVFDDDYDAKWRRAMARRRTTL